MSGFAFAPRENDKLLALVYQAYELRDTGYLLDACAAVVDWYERRPLARYQGQLEAAGHERRRRTSELIALLREGA